MKLPISIFAAAMAVSTAAAQNQCWTNSANDLTNDKSPLVTDCQALADDPDMLPEIWIPSEENNYSFDTFNGTCGIRGVFNPSGGSLPANEMTIRSGVVRVTILNTIATKAVDGRCAANGAIACMIPGMNVQIGWERSGRVSA